MRIKNLTEQYFRSIYSKKGSGESFDIYKNPTKSEVSELAREHNIVRFIAHSGDFYLFPGHLPHHHAVEYIGLPLPLNPKIRDAFLGIAKATRNGGLDYYDSNQIEPEQLAEVVRFHPYIEKFFR